MFDFDQNLFAVAFNLNPDDVSSSQPSKFIESRKTRQSQRFGRSRTVRPADGCTSMQANRGCRISINPPVSLVLFLDG